jgi:hypothetical protein
MIHKTIIKKEFADHNVADLSVETNALDYSTPSGTFIEIKIENKASTMMSINGIESDILVLKLNGQSEREMLKELCQMILHAL